MKTLVSTLEKLLADKDWDLERTDDEGESFLRGRVQGENGAYDVLVIADEDLDAIQMCVVFPQNIPEARRTAVAEYITRANWQRMVGFFAMDLDDGQLMTRVGFDVEGATLSAEMLDNALGIVASLLNAHVPGIMAVCYGNKSPVEALSEVAAHLDSGDDSED